MRILILTAIPFWHPGTGELINELKRRGLFVEAADIFHGYLIDQQGVQHDLVNLKGIFRRIYLKLFRKKITKELIKKYDILDIHFVEPLYANYLLDADKKIICTLFGSDLFRTSPEKKAAQYPLFQKADRILLSKNMVPYFTEHFKEVDQGKFLYNQYGSKRLDLIAEEEPNSLDKPFYICCGYNEKREQQHLQIIEELMKLSDQTKQDLHFLFPMTYGDDNENKLAVKSKLANSDLNYTIYENRMNDREIADLRLKSCITINTQTTDALASSIKEAMVAGNIMLIGEWLPYDIYRELGVYYKEVNFGNLAAKLQLTLEELKEEREKSIKNAPLIMNFASWNKLAEKWISDYKALFNERK